MSDMQMGAAPNSGPAPAPYTGADVSPEPPGYGPPVDLAADPGMDVMAGIAPGNAVQEAGYAHDMNAGLVTPYYGGVIAPIQVQGDADAGGRDDVADSVAGAVAASSARWHEHQADTYQQGSTIGDLMTFPPSPLDPGTVAGITDPSGAFYDPPRVGNEPQ